MERSGIDRRSPVGVWVGNLPGPLAMLNRFSLTRYLVASIISLAFDVACYLALVTMGVVAALSSAAGYMLGIAVHWLISSSFVFPGKKREGAALYWQRAFFAASALVGLGVTVAIVAAATAAGADPLTAKILAILTSFILVYLIRKWGVFK